MVPPRDSSSVTVCRMAALAFWNAAKLAIACRWALTIVGADFDLLMGSDLAEAQIGLTLRP